MRKGRGERTGESIGPGHTHSRTHNKSITASRVTNSPPRQTRMVRSRRTKKIAAGTAPALRRTDRTNIAETRDAR